MNQYAANTVAKEFLECKELMHLFDADARLSQEEQHRVQSLEREIAKILADTKPTRGYQAKLRAVHHQILQLYLEHCKQAHEAKMVNETSPHLYDLREAVAKFEPKHDKILQYQEGSDFTPRRSPQEIHKSHRHLLTSLQNMKIASELLGLKADLSSKAFIPGYTSEDDRIFVNQLAAESERVKHEINTKGLSPNTAEYASEQRKLDFLEDKSTHHFLLHFVLYHAKLTSQASQAAGLPLTTVALPRAPSKQPPTVPPLASSTSPSYTCPVCREQMANDGEVIRKHNRKHPRERYVCEIKQCPSAIFKRPDNLKTHFHRIHKMDDNTARQERIAVYLVEKDGNDTELRGSRRHCALSEASATKDALLRDFPEHTRNR